MTEKDLHDIVGFGHGRGLVPASLTLKYLHP